MKQILIVMLAVYLAAVTGCSSTSSLNESSISEAASRTDTLRGSNEPSSTETTAEQTPTPEERRDNSRTEETVSPKSGQTTSKTTTATVSSAKETRPTASTTEKAPDESGAVRTGEEADCTLESKATAADAKAVAVKIAEYINAYRAEQGVSAAVILPGLTEYAEYRSRQLVKNFAHDIADARAAATALRYGQYIDPAVYNMTGEPYYTANAREAIVRSDYGGTVDHVARRLSRLTRNSPSHWSYVGDADYAYMAIGIICNDGIWYCDIAVSTVNTDN